MTESDGMFSAPSEATAITVIAGSIGGDTVQTVNARDLHAFLEVGKDFSNWVKARIEQYDFVENRDFVVFARSGENSSGGRPAKDYALTIHMAKELAMVERNERGRRARAYFIECERRARATTADPTAALGDPAALRGLLLTYSEKVLALEAVNAELAPKAIALDRLSTADGSLCITDAAKAIQVRPKALFSYLREHNWIYRRPGGKSYLGYQTRVTSGLLEHKVTTVLRADGSEKIVEQVLITPRGLTKLAMLLQPIGAVVAAA